MKLVRPMTCDFMVYKDYKNQPLKLVFPTCGINFRIQHLTCPLLNHRTTIHHNISLKSLPREFPHRILHQILIIHFLVNDLLLSKFIQDAIQAGVSEPKITSLYLVIVSLMASSVSCFSFIQFRRGIFNFFASSKSDVLFIYY